MEFNSLMTRPHHEKGAEMQLIDPNTGEQTDVYFTVLGCEADSVIDVLKEEETARLRAMFGKDSEFDQKQWDIKVALVMVTGWRGITENGKDVNFSEAKARKLFEQTPAIRKQVRNFAGKPQNFTPKPQTES